MDTAHLPLQRVAEVEFPSQDSLLARKPQAWQELTGNSFGIRFDIVGAFL